jgi:hypothetical protein
MRCDDVKRRFPAFLDGRLDDDARKSLTAHLELCPRCAEQLESADPVRTALRGLRSGAVPPQLATRLRVLASHERERRVAMATLPSRLRYSLRRVELLFDNLMRPMALPFAGGLLSAMLLFGAMVPTLNFQHNFVTDMPNSFFTLPDGKVVNWGRYMPRLEPLSARRTGDETALLLTIDEKGRVLNYSMEHGAMTKDIQEFILFSQFTPATLFGQPTQGKVQVFFPAAPAHT